jgi:hypothetical protein
VVARFVLAMVAEPWSAEFQICVAFAAGLALGVLVATGGAQF